jgi:undecaprenyl-diphosphatase
MDLPLLVKALVMGVVEGLTEFLPISSTGHLILVGHLLDFDNDKAKIFEIFIQTGAMFAIVGEYHQRFLSVARDCLRDAKARRFVLNLAVAFLPAAILGFLFGNFIKSHLFKPVPVAVAFIAGALVILWADRRKVEARVHSVDDMTLLDAFKVGCAQCLALFPGTSRSGATIIGGMLFGLSRRTATEFSFFLAVPTLLAAGGYDLLKNRALLEAGDVPVFATGFIAALLSAFLCVRWLLRYITSHDFTAFAWYRIGFGIVVLATAYLGYVEWNAS